MHSYAHTHTSTRAHACSLWHAPGCAGAATQSDVFPSWRSRHGLSHPLAPASGRADACVCVRTQLCNVTFGKRATCDLCLCLCLNLSVCQSACLSCASVSFCGCVCASVCFCVCVCICACVCLCLCLSLCLARQGWATQCVCVCVCVCACVCVCVGACVTVCVCVSACLCTCVGTFTYCTPAYRLSRPHQRVQDLIRLKDKSARIEIQNDPTG